MSVVGLSRINTCSRACMNPPETRSGRHARGANATRRQGHEKHSSSMIASPRAYVPCRGSEKTRSPKDDNDGHRHCCCLLVDLLSVEVAMAKQGREGAEDHESIMYVYVLAKMVTAFHFLGRFSMACSTREHIEDDHVDVELVAPIMLAGSL